MAVQGPHTRTVRDARLALQVMARGDRRDWRWNDVPMQGPPPARPIKVAIVPEVPGGPTHPAQAAAVRLAGKHLQAAGYVVEEVLPPDMERGVELWHMICVTDVFSGLWPQMQKMGDPDGIASMKGWLDLHKAVDLPTYVAALTEREGLLLRWMTFFQQWPLVILPTLADLPPRQVADIEPGGQKKILESMRPALLAPLLGLPGLAVPVGSHGKLRSGVQIMAMRNREDLCLDAGEVIEAAEGVVTPIDPRASRAAAGRSWRRAAAFQHGNADAVFPSWHCAMATLASMVPDRPSGRPTCWKRSLVLLRQRLAVVGVARLRRCAERQQAATAGTSQWTDFMTLPVADESRARVYASFLTTS